MKVIWALLSNGKGAWLLTWGVVTSWQSECPSVLLTSMWVEKLYSSRLLLQTGTVATIQAE